VPSFQGHDVLLVHLLQDEDTPTVTFPDDYPNSVRHFLLIGFLGMFIGAIVFFYMGISRKVNTVMHVLTFFIAAVSAPTALAIRLAEETDVTLLGFVRKQGHVVYARPHRLR
jgi:hypothetical protein